MNRILQKYATAACIAFGSFVFGQFNTLKPTVPKKQETNIASDSDNGKSKEIEKEKENKEKKSWKKVFGITTKTDLKNQTEGSTKWLTSQIDSLKTMIKENSAANSKKWDMKKIQDSLMLSAQSIMMNRPQNNRNLLTQYDFVNEPKELSFSKIVMPLHRNISITSPYGARTHPIFGTSKFHNGIDLAAHYENVYSVLDGIVTETGWDNKGGGNYIKIRHFNRFETAYLHLSEIFYRAGERVNAGFIIAKSGNSGNSTGPHLHFSVKEFGQSINPAHFLNDLIKVNNLITLYNE